MVKHRQRVTVFGVGNTATGDDGLGPLLLQSIRESERDDDWWLKLVEDTQLQVEHALDLQLCDLALFIQTSVDVPAPCVLSEIDVPEGHRLATTTHALAPLDVLHTLATISRGTPPPVFVLTVRGEQFEPDAGLSAAARENLAAATELLETLLESTDAGEWRTRQTS